MAFTTKHKLSFSHHSNNDIFYKWRRRCLFSKSYEGLIRPYFSTTLLLLCALPAAHPRLQQKASLQTESWGILGVLISSWFSCAVAEACEVENFVMCCLLVQEGISHCWLLFLLKSCCRLFSRFCLRATAPFQKSPHFDSSDCPHATDLHAAPT